VFKSKFYRAIVGASGMLVELFIAALAFYGWMLLEPSALRAMLFNVMVVACVSTLIFNGNPLLRYDAYYILSDLIEMPNLATRSMRYLGYLIERYAFGASDAHSPEDSASEKAWLVGYGVLSSIYRVFVTIAIALFIASEFFIIGVVLALWALIMMAVVPVFKSVKHAVTSPRLRRQRPRVLGVSLGFAVVLLVLLFVVPAPFRTLAQGVAWLPQSALVRAGQDGFITRLVAAPGGQVKSGELLMELREPALEAELSVAKARQAELDAIYGAQLVADRSQAAMALDQLQAQRAALAALQQRSDALSVRAQSAGTFTLAKAQDLQGRFYRQGDLLGYVLDKPELIVRVVVAQEDVHAVRSITQAVQVRLAHQIEQVLVGRLEREVPGGAQYLPSVALATEGGGELPTDPRDSQGARTLERTFQFDIAVQLDSPELAPLFFGERAHVRFVHPGEPIALQWYRSVRRLFLSQFHV
jgi:putative peptide zinc metalloprotease protein